MPAITCFSMGEGTFYPFTMLGCKDKFIVNSLEVLKIAKARPSLVIFWGGQDIHPSLYQEKHSVYSGATSELVGRDVFERDAYAFCLEHGLPVVGICRGAQLMTALNGGKLIQHVNGHGGDHPVRTIDGQEFKVTSTHHQMMLPKGEFELVAWSKEKRSDVYMGAGVKEIEECHADDFKEPEIVFFPKTRTLAIQGHPEYLSEKSPFVQYTLKLIQEKLHVG